MSAALPATKRRRSALLQRAGDGLLPSLLVSLVAVAGLIAVISDDPFTAIHTTFTAPFTRLGMTNTIQQAAPILLVAVSAAYTLRAGVLNIGGEGQMLVGALGGTVVALHMGGPSILTVPTAYLAAAVAGGALALLSGVMYTKLGAPIYITSLLLNYPAASLVSYLVRFQMKDPTTSEIATARFGTHFEIPKLAPPGSALHGALTWAFGDDSLVVQVMAGIDLSAPAAIVGLVVFALVCKRTVVGYEAGVTGQNSRFAVYGGVDLATTTLRTMFVGGAISGAVGALVALGSQRRLIDGAVSATNYAWTGLLVALVAGSAAIPLLLAAVAFSAMTISGQYLQRETGISSQIANVMRATIILLVSMRITLPRWRRRRYDTVDAMPPLAEL